MHEGTGPWRPGAADRCRLSRQLLYDYLRHTFLAYVSVLVSLFSVGFLWKDVWRKKIVDAGLV